MKINIEDYVSEEEMRSIALDVFREKIKESFGGDQYSVSGKERDRVIKNAVSKWITDYIESQLTEDDKNLIRSNVELAIKNTKDYSFYIFTKPDVWDRYEYSAQKIIQKYVQENEKFIKDKVSSEIFNKFDTASDV